MRLEGFLNVKVERSGGEGSSGVSGTGSGFDGGGCLRRACNFGKRSLRSGIAIDVMSLAVEGVVVVDGILNPDLAECVDAGSKVGRSPGHFEGGVAGIAPAF